MNLALGVGATTLSRRAARRALCALPEEWQLRLRRHRNRRRPLPAMSLGILTGDTPWTLGEYGRVRNPILTADDVSDVDAAFVADPFALQHEGQWHLFFEILNRLTGKGEIGWASSSDLETWHYGGIVLEEPFHLSYPAVYRWRGEMWMIPESWEARQVRLYRAVSFPRRWVLERILVDDVAGTDPTLFPREGGGWSMLLCSAEGGHNQTLWRYDAPSFLGPWGEAAESPLVEGNPAQARPGGHSVTFEGERYRLGQDCSTRYGERLRSYPLTPPWTEGGRDVLIPTDGWRGRGGHHADIHPSPWGGLLAFVDGEA